MRKGFDIWEAPSRPTSNTTESTRPSSSPTSDRASSTARASGRKGRGPRWQRPRFSPCASTKRWRDWTAWSPGAKSLSLGKDTTTSKASSRMIRFTAIHVLKVRLGQPYPGQRQAVSQAALRGLFQLPAADRIHPIGGREERPRQHRGPRRGLCRLLLRELRHSCEGEELK